MDCKQLGYWYACFWFLVSGSLGISLYSHYDRLDKDVCNGILKFPYIMGQLSNVASSVRNTAYCVPRTASMVRAFLPWHSTPPRTGAGTVAGL